MQILIVSSSWIHTARVEARLRALGHAPIRLETDSFPEASRLSLRDDGSATLVLPSGTHHLEWPQVLWYRRMAVRVPPLPEAPPELRAGVHQELSSFLFGLVNRAEWVMDPKARLANAEHKPRQLALAAACGLDVPATLCSSSADEVRAWAEALGRPLVTKVFTSWAIQDQGQDKVVHTTAIGPEHLATLDGLEMCPAVFQERLPKVKEYRVTVVGERLFTMSVDSPAVAEGAVDWRRASDALLDRWVPDTLPEHAAVGLLRLMDRLRLNYGAADFVLTPDGRCVFLEVNPAGEYLWLDSKLGGAISVAIAEHLAGLTPRR